MKLGVVGSRNITSKELVFKVINGIDKLSSITCIVSGGAKGVDNLAEQWANENQKDLIIHLPDLKNYGLRGLFIRNQRIIDDSDVVVAIWDGKSKGTLDSINKARKSGKRYYVKIIQEEGTFFQTT